MAAPDIEPALDDFLNSTKAWRQNQQVYIPYYAVSLYYIIIILYIIIYNIHIMQAAQERQVEAQRAAFVQAGTRRAQQRKKGALLHLFHSLDSGQTGR